MDDIVKQFPSVFSGKVGKLCGFVHKIILKDNAVPVCHKARNIPIRTKEGVMAELDALEKKGIIEPVESAEWLAPLVVARKPDVRLRLCIDLRDLNKNIVVDKFPLPRIDSYSHRPRALSGFRP